MKTQRGRWIRREGGGIHSKPRERGRERAAEKERGSFWTPSSCQDFQLSCTLSSPVELLSLHTANTDFPSRQRRSSRWTYLRSPGLWSSAEDKHAHNALHGANFNSQLCKCRLSAPPCCSLMPSSSLTLSPLAVLLFLLWALCRSCL